MFGSLLIQPGPTRVDLSGAPQFQTYNLHSPELSRDDTFWIDQAAVTSKQPTGSRLRVPCLVDPVSCLSQHRPKGVPDSQYGRSFLFPQISY